MDDDTRLREAVRIYGESRWGLGEWELIVFLPLSTG